MLKDVSKDKRYVRKYDPKTKMMHVWARGAPVPVCVAQGHEKAMDWNQVFGETARPSCIDHSFNMAATRCCRCGVDRKGALVYSCIPDQRRKEKPDGSQLA